MRLLHLADLHLGKVIYGYSMIEDQRYILQQVLETAAHERVDAVLMAGDIYDRSVASEEAVHLFDWFLVELAALSVAVLIIGGNHDSGERLNYGRRLFADSRIHIAGTYAPDLGKVTLEDAFGPVHFYLLPFVQRATLRRAWPEDGIDSLTAAMATAVGHGAVDFSARNVLLTHQFVAHGEARPEVGGSEVMAASVGTIEAIGSEVFDGFDYVAMGHIHRPQWIGRETLRYAGSPLKYSLREAQDKKSVPLVTLGEKGAVQVELLPLSPLRDLRHVAGALEKLRETAQGTEDYMHVTLTDEVPVLDAMALVKQIYPHTMKVDFESARLRARRTAAPAVAEGKNFAELVKDFYAAGDEAPPSDEEWSVLLDAARDAGVIE